MTSTEPSADEIRLDRYVIAVWRAKWWIILLALVATAVAAFIANRQPAVHEATALVEVGRVWNQPLKQLQSSSRDTAIKLESELEEVRTNNTSPIATSKTHLVDKIVPGKAIKPPIWRSAASWGLVAALAGLIVALMIGHARGRTH